MYLRELKTTFSDLSRKFTKIKVAVPALDTVPLARIIAEGINSIQKIVAAQPNADLHEKSILFSRSAIKSSTTLQGHHF